MKKPVPSEHDTPLLVVEAPPSNGGKLIEGFNTNSKIANAIAEASRSLILPDNYHMANTAAKLENLSREIDKHGEMIFDSETSGLDAWRDRLLCISIWTGGQGYLVPLDHKLMSVVDFRLDPTCAMWLDGERSDLAEVKGWLRLNDGVGTWDAWTLLFASDGLPPATFPLGSSGWVPTLQLPSYVHQIPNGEWLRARQWCVVITDGLVEERCELFDDRDQLVATSSQLAMVRFSARAQ